MAQPDNTHHVHGDGYRSDRGSADRERMLRDVADEIEMHDCTLTALVDVDTDGPYVRVEASERPLTTDNIDAIVGSYDCAVAVLRDDWCIVRPE